jgi:hypothetical protein
MKAYEHGNIVAILFFSQIWVSFTGRCLPNRATVRSLVLCRNPFRLVDELLFVLAFQGLAVAVGAIDDQVIVASHHGGEEKPLNSLRLEFAGQIHRSWSMSRA